MKRRFFSTCQEADFPAWWRVSGVPEQVRHCASLIDRSMPGVLGDRLVLDGRSAGAVCITPRPASGSRTPVLSGRRELRNGMSGLADSFSLGTSARTVRGILLW